MKKILVVDDDPKIVAALAVRLAAAGYEMSSAPDGLEGLKAAVTSPPDLILLDVWVPVGLGFSVAQRLQQIGLERIPVIFNTASKKGGLCAAAMALGAAGYLETPYKAEELLAMIAQVPGETERATPVRHNLLTQPVNE